MSHLSLLETPVSYPEHRHPVVFESPTSETIVGSLAMPFQSGRNPYTASIADASVDWLVDMGVLEADSPSCRAFEGANVHGLAGLVHRYESAEDLLLATNFYSTMFVFDDMLDAGGSRVGSVPEFVRRSTALMMDALRWGRAPQQALPAEEWPLPLAHRQKLAAIARCFADVVRRLKARPNSPDLGYFLHEMDEYFRGIVEESTCRAERAFPSLEAYAQARLKFGAMYACVEFGALLRRLAPTAIARRFRPYRRMVRNTNLCVSYVNDLFSYKKEHALGEVSNLVMVIEQVEDQDRSAAFRKACRICDHVMEEYVADKQRCEQLEPDAKAGIELLEDWMRGHYDWYHENTTRYAEALTTHPSSGPLQRAAS